MGSRARLRVRIAALALGACLLLPAAADARERRDAAFIAAASFDVWLLRPLGLISTIVGTAFFVPAAVLSFPSGPEAVERAWETFVVTPAKNTFTRPIGEF